MQVNIEAYNLNDFSTNTTVKLNLVHNILSLQIPEVRFDLFQNIDSIKAVCEKKFGSDSSLMQLYLQDKNGNTLCAMLDGQRDLGFYSPQDGYFIYVVDLNPNSLAKELEDLSQVEKYVMSEEDYDKLPNSFRKFKKEFIKANAKPKTDSSNEDFMKEEADKIQRKNIKYPLLLLKKVGSRCQLVELKRRGEVKYVGKIPELGEGYFVGVRLDEPFMNNNGTVKGKLYFECPTNYAIFLRPNKLEVGDFPELDLDDEI